MKRMDKIKHYRAKAEQLQARADREAAKERTAERKRDTRRKILLGATFNHALSGGVSPDVALKMIGCLNQYIASDRDRELLGLCIVNTHNTNR